MVYNVLQDAEDDCKIGVKSTALLLGKHPHRWLGGCGVAMAGMMVAAGLNSGQEWPYYLGVTACLGHVAWQVRGREGEGMRERECGEGESGREDKGERKRVGRGREGERIRGRERVGRGREREWGGGEWKRG